MHWEDEESLGIGYFEYRYLGSTGSGVHVFLTALSGGGSGVFEDLLFVRIDCDRGVMSRTGEFTLGDRDDGRVELRGDRLFIGRSRYRSEDVLLDLE